MFTKSIYSQWGYSRYQDHPSCSAKGKQVPVKKELSEKRKVSSMSLGKLSAMENEMNQLHTDIWCISELKWTGIEHLQSEKSYYYNSRHTHTHTKKTSRREETKKQSKFSKFKKRFRPQFGLLSS